jgi:hypothetical protein
MGAVATSPTVATGVHKHSRISRVPVVTATMCYVVSNYLCGSVPIYAREVGLIGRSLLWLLVATNPGDITE